MRSQWQGPEEQEGGDAEPPPVAGAGAVVCLMGVSANVREGQQVRQYGLRTNTVALTATGSCSIWQFTGSEGLDEAYVPFFGAFGAAWNDAMVAHCSASPLGMLWPEMDAVFLASGGNGGPPATAQRPVVLILAG
ncbi:MAG: hypothetical protein OET79_08370 [Nitrospirota bacterium]|nr:hypothetical protein [Nitrospirota bacterium]